jgi:hypothetical protein
LKYLDARHTSPSEANMKLRARTGHPSSYQISKPLIFENRPPLPFRLGGKPPNITDLNSFQKLHEGADETIKDYLEKQRVDWQHLDAAACRELERYGTYWDLQCDHLLANNVQSRIRLAEIAWRHIGLHPASVEGPVFMVTLTPGQYALPEAEGPTFDVRKIKAWTRQVLAGFEFIGMVEAGFFPEFPAKTKPTVSWHVHLLVWGATYQRLNQILREVRREYPSFVPGVPSAHTLRLTSVEQIQLRVLYMLKAPQKRYRVYFKDEEVLNEMTGEITRGKGKITKDWLRTGERVRMCRVMAGRLLDDLLFGQGAGTQLRGEIVEEALAAFRAQERRKAARSVWREARQSDHARH